VIPRWARLEKFLNYALIFLLPTQLALHFWPPTAFVFGVRVDYLAPSIYLTDVLFLTVFVFWIKYHNDKLFGFIKKNKVFLFLFLFIVILNTAFSTSFGPSIYKWIKFTELGLFYFYVRARGDIFNSRTLYATIFYSLIFFSVIGISQFVLGKTLGGPLYLLGERSFRISTPGIALTQILDRNFMRAYSTFSHPNSFAGYLGLGLLTLLFTYSKKELARRIWGILIICIAFVLTFSLSAFVGIVFCGILFILLRKKTFNTKSLVLFLTIFTLISLAQPLVSNFVLNTIPDLPQSVSQRFDLSSVAGKMISDKFLLGEGLNTFVINEPRIKHFGNYLWTLQPVHNVSLLLFSETGIIGLSFFYLVLIKLSKKATGLKGAPFYLSLIFILTSGLFDHYWLTLQQNMFFSVFILANSFRAEG